MTNQPKPNTLAERLREFLLLQFPATSGNVQMEALLDEVREAADALEAKDREIATLKEHIRVLSAPLTKG